MLHPASPISHSASSSQPVTLSTCETGPRKGPSWSALRSALSPAWGTILPGDRSILMDLRTAVDFQLVQLISFLRGHLSVWKLEVS